MLFSLSLLWHILVFFTEDIWLDPGDIGWWMPKGIFWPSFAHRQFLTLLCPKAVSDLLDNCTWPRPGTTCSAAGRDRPHPRPVGGGAELSSHAGMGQAARKETQQGWRNTPGKGQPYPYCLFFFLFFFVFFLFFFVFFLFGVSDYLVHDWYLYANILHRNFLRFTPPRLTLLIRTSVYGWQLSRRQTSQLESSRYAFMSYYVEPFHVRWSDGMQFCRSDWPGLCLLANRVDLGSFFLFHKFFHFTSPIDLVINRHCSGPWRLWPNHPMGWSWTCKRHSADSTRASSTDAHIHSFRASWGGGSFSSLLLSYGEVLTMGKLYLLLFSPPPPQIYVIAFFHAAVQERRKFGKVSNLLFSFWTVNTLDLLLTFGVDGFGQIQPYFLFPIALIIQNSRTHQNSRTAWSWHLV